MEAWQQGGFGVYLHWPYCQSKCPYCDFNSHVTQAVDQSRWAAAYVAEIHRVGAETGNRVVNSIFFGGGTPSLMDPALVEAVIRQIHNTWTVANDIEITLEANPGSVEAGRFNAYAAAGVNRVSLGVQALNDVDLRRLGRLHSAADAHKAIEIAQSSFSRVSIDLIYARQDQSVEAWERELQTALSLGTSHLSLYQLTVEDGTVFGRLHRRNMLRGLPGEDAAADMFEATREICMDAGLPAYEVSNHAREGEESRHNLIYWRAGDYVGIGPGAHGRLTLSGRRYATAAERMPDKWLRSVELGKAGDVTCDELSGPEQAAEYLMMSLRLTEGASLERYRKIAGTPVNPTAFSGLIELGLLSLDGERLSTTSRGVLMLDGILRSLLVGRETAA